MHDLNKHIHIQILKKNKLVLKYRLQGDAKIQSEGFYNPLFRQNLPMLLPISAALFRAV